MPVLDKAQFVRSTLRPMAEYTLPYVASVIGVVDARRGEHVGSALRCEYGGKRAILTAAHVMEQANREYSGVAVSAGYGISPYQVHGEVQIKRVADLAICVLPDDYPGDSEQVGFWPEHRIDCTSERLSTDYLFAHGFPGQQTKFFTLVQGLASKSLPYGAMQRLDGIPPELGAHEFAIDFDPGNMQLDDDSLASPPDPHGLSGSPVWRIGASGRSTREWTPQSSLLVGILTQWLPDEKLLVATKAEELFRPA